MNIAMFTNTYLPRIGGVVTSILTFARAYRAHGHHVMIVAPQAKPTISFPDVIAVPAIRLKTINDVALPVIMPGSLTRPIENMKPDIIHAHHPFLLGHAAAMAAAQSNAPLIFTHHTMYEHYTHYAPVDSPQLKKFVKDLSTGYANLCDCVFAPTKSVADIIKKRGVKTPIEIVPTGIELSRFQGGDRRGARKKYGIPPGAFVVGHSGRLAPEKNLRFLMRAVVTFLQEKPHAHALFVGSGPLLRKLRAHARRLSLTHRVHFTGALKNKKLTDAYTAMDLFAMSSLSETQGLVLLEAQAARVPIVALEAPGTRDVVANHRSGWLIKPRTQTAFIQVLHQAHQAITQNPSRFAQAAYDQASKFSADICAARALRLYESSIEAKHTVETASDITWPTTRRLVATKWKLWENRLAAAQAAVNATLPS